MDFTIAFTVIVLVCFVFLIAYGLLKIHKDGFHLGRVSAWEEKFSLKPSDPEKRPAYKIITDPHQAEPEGPPIYSLREPFGSPTGPFDVVPQHQETPLGPPGV